METPATIKLYSLSPTDRDDVFRVMDINGDWRWYFHQVRPEVTGPDGVCVLPELARYVPAVNAVLDAGYPKDRRFHDYLLSVSKEEAKRILETAGERGSRVHNAIQLLEEGQTLTFQQLLPNSLTGKPEPLSLDEWKCLLAWALFVAEFNMKVIPCKRTVVGNGYAGTLDDIVEVTIPESAKRSFPAELIGKTIRVLLDYKTSGGIYESYWAQVASYYMADHGIPGITHTGILRLGTAHKSGYEFKIRPVKSDNEEDTTVMHDYAEFRCARRFWEAKTTPFSPDDMGSSLPSSLTVSIPTQSAAIASTPLAQPSNSGIANEAINNVGQQLSHPEANASGVESDSGRVLPRRVRGRSASGDTVERSKGNQAEVPVRHPRGRGVRGGKAVSEGGSDGL